MAKEKKTLKFQMMMSPKEAETLDDWMFKNRVRSRAEAIRRLSQLGIVAHAGAINASTQISTALRELRQVGLDNTLAEPGILAACRLLDVARVELKAIEAIGKVISSHEDPMIAEAAANLHDTWRATIDQFSSEVGAGEREGVDKEIDE